VKHVPDTGQVERLAAVLVDALEVDWVSIPSMPAFAAEVSGTWDRRANRALVAATLLALLDDPAVKIVTDDMTRELTDAGALSRHLDAEWPDDGEPIEKDVGWLVERDFELAQPLDPS
jgi:hypothetical protein